MSSYNVFGDYYPDWEETISEILFAEYGLTMDEVEEVIDLLNLFNEGADMEEIVQHIRDQGLLDD